MNALWTFEGGRLVARNLAGAVLWAWLTDEAMGRPLADLLNHAQGLSRLLLPPWGLNHKPPKFPSLQLQSVEQRIQVNRFAAILEGVVPAQ